MGMIQKIKIYGDSILKGVQISYENMRYHIDNNIGIASLSEKYALQIENCSKFGCTITKGRQLLETAVEKGLSCDVVLMDYGGNDCDFRWKEISDEPESEHLPNTPLELFRETYQKIILLLKKANIMPVLTTLPPIDPERYFRWFCGDTLNRENVLQWLGSVNTIYRYQEMYSHTVEEIARTENVPLIDLRATFLAHRRIDMFLCDDGIHPNTAGQQLIGGTFDTFMARKLPLTT